MGVEDGRNERSSSVVYDERSYRGVRDDKGERSSNVVKI